MASLRMQKSNWKMQNYGIRLRRMADFIDFFVLYNILLNKKLHQFLTKKIGQFELLVFFLRIFFFRLIYI